jgi:hypothetical protein
MLVVADWMNFSYLFTYWNIINCLFESEKQLLLSKSVSAKNKNVKQGYKCVE